MSLKTKSRLLVVVCTLLVLATTLSLVALGFTLEDQLSDEVLGFFVGIVGGFMSALHGWALASLMIYLHEGGLW